MKPLCVLQASVSPREDPCVDQGETPKHSGSLVSLLTGAGCVHTLVQISPVTAAKALWTKHGTIPAAQPKPSKGGELVEATAPHLLARNCERNFIHYAIGDDAVIQVQLGLPQDRQRRSCPGRCIEGSSPGFNHFNKEGFVKALRTVSGHSLTVIDKLFRESR